MTPLMSLEDFIYFSEGEGGIWRVTVEECWMTCIQQKYVLGLGCEISAEAQKFFFLGQYISLYPSLDVAILK